MRELVARTGHIQNLISYHLRLLRKSGVITSTRSSHDARDSYYHLDLQHCAEQPAAAGPVLHLKPPPPPTDQIDPSVRAPASPDGYEPSNWSLRSPLESHRGSSESLTASSAMRCTMMRYVDLVGELGYSAVRTFRLERRAWAVDRAGT
ncbi:Uncharacterised protein [Mycobacteroides abscessus subsp. abscessus]|nr:Uncharacterised protein [Mycobacteroides abscessus subsp. abscessus]SHU29061.1 Uncharacterised protein [Mycobacteroides abscessus subsp. abscessus]SHV34719.1 Uncharacterised protein [Mycobacteroides abscessus subsp. abscessus]SHV73619.1 Uncharacterised protein [Mycobacteroides abscessus subsp. abscessus]SHX95579.1 Uncharacterised protein [Mycobacteroides abscessus subsp. abscessus]